jgi:hypothetical protein
MTASALGSGAFLSPLGNLAPWSRPPGPSERVSSLGTLHERLADAGGAVDTSADDGKQESPQGDSPRREEARTGEGAWQKEKKRVKKRVEGTRVEGKKLGTKKDLPVRESDEGEAGASRKSKERPTRDEDELEGFLARVDIGQGEERVPPLEQERQPRVGRRQLLQQLSVDQERLKAFLGEGDESGDLLQRIPHANLKEIERLRKEIEKKEEMLKRKLLEEDTDSSASSGSDREERKSVEKERNKGLGNGKVHQNARDSDAPARGQSAAKRAEKTGVGAVNGRMESEDGEKEVHQKGKEPPEEKQSAMDAAALREKKQRKRRELQEELKRVKASQESIKEGRERTGASGEAPGKDGQKEKVSKDWQKEKVSKDWTATEEKEQRKGLKEGRIDKEGKGGEEGRANGQGETGWRETALAREGTPVAQERGKKQVLSSETKKKPPQEDAHEEAPEKAKAKPDRSKDDGSSEQVHDRLPSATSSKGEKKKKKKRREHVVSPKSAERDAADAQDHTRKTEQRASSGNLQRPKESVKKTSAEGKDVPRSHQKAALAAAQDALSEPQQQRIKQSAAAGKLVAEGQIDKDFVALGERAAPGDDDWVLCTKCNKWRMLPYWLSAEQFDPIKDWTCSDTSWLE